MPLTSSRWSFRYFSPNPSRELCVVQLLDCDDLEIFDGLWTKNEFSAASSCYWINSEEGQVRTSTNLYMSKPALMTLSCYCTALPPNTSPSRSKTTATEEIPKSDSSTSKATVLFMPNATSESSNKQVKRKFWEFPPLSRYNFLRSREVKRGSEIKTAV